MDSRLTDVNKALKDVDKAIADWEWGIASEDPAYLSRGPNPLQVLYLEREHLDYHQKLGDLYIPNF